MSIFQPTKVEREFAEWVKSIQFVDKDNNVVLPVLTDDETEDFDGDREGVE